jgi:hypothetical protein
MSGLIFNIDEMAIKGMHQRSSVVIARLADGYYLKIGGKPALNLYSADESYGLSLY